MNRLFLITVFLFLSHSIVFSQRMRAPVSVFQMIRGKLFYFIHGGPITLY